MSNEVKRYRIKQANWAYMQQSDDGDYVRYDNYAALEAECERLRMQLAACGVVALANTPKSAAQARQMHPDYMSASCSDVADAVGREMTLRRQRDKLAKVLEDVEHEHDLIRRMKNCEIHRGRGSFGIAVMSDPLALEWQALDKELQQFVDARRAALAASTGQEVE